MRPAFSLSWMMLARDGYPPGQQRALSLAVLEQNDVIIVGAQDPGLIRSAKFLTAPTMGPLFRLIADRLGGSLDLLVVPHALLTLPIVQG